MRSAAIRLDSFSTQLAQTDKGQSLDASMDQAFHRGYEQGLNDGRELSLDALTAALRELQQQSLASRHLTTDAQRQMAQTLAPVLSAIIDILAPRACAERLHSALMAELLQLAETALPRKLRIRCTPDLRPDVELCLARLENSAAQIEEITQEEPSVELIADKAAIRFDPQRMVSELQFIINDIMTED